MVGLGCKLLLCFVTIIIPCIHKGRDNSWEMSATNALWSLENALLCQYLCQRDCLTTEALIAIHETLELDVYCPCLTHDTTCTQHDHAPGKTMQGCKEAVIHFQSQVQMALRKRFPLIYALPCCLLEGPHEKPEQSQSLGHYWRKLYRLWEISRLLLEVIQIITISSKGWLSNDSIEESLMFCHTLAECCCGLHTHTDQCVGIVILMLDNKMEPAVARNMIKGLPDTLHSEFRLSYSMLLNLQRGEGRMKAKELLASSFKQFQVEQALPALKQKVQKLEVEEPSFSPSLSLPTSQSPSPDAISLKMSAN